MRKQLSLFTFQDMIVQYLTDLEGHVGLLLAPADMLGEIKEQKAYAIDSLVQVKVLGDDYPAPFAHGHTMRNGQSVTNLRFERQDVIETDTETTVVTILQTSSGHSAEHRLTWYAESEAFEIETIYRNGSERPIELEMLSSASLGSLTPFEEGEAPNTLRLHRLRSVWSMEGRLETIPIEDLQLEPSWARHAMLSERFGQLGSTPVRKFFPFAAIEDSKRGVFWGLQLACASSWQIEAYRKDDALCLSGGLADAEFGHWQKTLLPGEELRTPKAYVTVARGEIDNVTRRLTTMQERPLTDQTGPETELPVMFNEYCTTWGKPYHDSIAAIVERLKGTPIKYFTIDAGWYAALDQDWQSNMGDWEVSPDLFPEGLEKTTDMIREANMIPGIWFEMEICGDEAAAFHQSDHLLKRQGNVITVGNRRFWDMQDPWVQDYLTEKVIGLLNRYGIGYIKVDYNANIGRGCDGAESQGEALRQKILATQEFFRKIRREVPGIVIENCASGGHRLEPSMMELCDMASFSDAHECPEIPIVALNLHRAILPRQNQIWAVLKQSDTIQRLVYSLAATYLGRMCLSGEVIELSDQQWQVVEDAMQFYQKIVPIVKQGVSYRYGPKIASYRFPEGWQALLRLSADVSQALVVIHTFGGQLPDRIEVPLREAAGFTIEASFLESPRDIRIINGKLVCPLLNNFEAVALHLRRVNA